MDIDFKIATKICAFNCREFNILVKHNETILENYDISFVQETVMSIPYSINNISTCKKSTILKT